MYLQFTLEVPWAIEVNPFFKGDQRLSSTHFRDILISILQAHLIDLGLAQDGCTRDTLDNTLILTNVLIMSSFQIQAIMFTYFLLEESSSCVTMSLYLISQSVDYMDLVKFVMYTLVSRDCIAFSQSIKHHVYPGNQGTHDR